MLPPDLFPAGDDGFVFDAEAPDRDRVLTAIVILAILVIATGSVAIAVMIVDRSGVL